jgi:hypothetical protein
MKSFDPMTTVLSAIENASVVPVTAADVLVALRTEKANRRICARCLATSRSKLW